MMSETMVSSYHKKSEMTVSKEACSSETSKTRIKPLLSKAIHENTHHLSAMVLSSKRANSLHKVIQQGKLFESFQRRLPWEMFEQFLIDHPDGFFVEITQYLQLCLSAEKGLFAKHTLRVKLSTDMCNGVDYGIWTNIRLD